MFSAAALPMDWLMIPFQATAFSTLA